jgi:hypothetical protein
MKKRTEAPQEIKNISYTIQLNSYPKEGRVSERYMDTYVHSTFFIIAKGWKHLKCPIDD